MTSKRLIAVSTLTLALVLAGCASAPTPVPPPAQTPSQPPSANKASPPGATDPTAVDSTRVSFNSKGYKIMAYLSRPKAAGKYPGLLIIHENRGLTPHIEDVARRFANQGYVALAAKYSNDPQAQFMAGWHAFALKQPDKYAGYFEKAYSLKPDNVEFRLFAGLAALSSKNYDKVISIMEGIKSENLYPAEELFRLTALQKAWKDRDQAKSDQYGQQITAILEKYQAQAAYKNRILPLLNAFGPQ